MICPECKSKEVELELGKITDNSLFIKLSYCQNCGYILEQKDIENLITKTNKP